MLNVNRDLGCRIISEDTWWEVPLGRVETYLMQRRGIAT